MAAANNQDYYVRFKVTGDQDFVAMQQAANKLGYEFKQLGIAARQSNGPTRAFSKDMTTMSKSARASSARLQNVGFQIQDFIVQVSSGTTALRAFGQQAPQALAVFGMNSPIFVGLSIMAAAIPAIAASLGLFSDEADKAEKAAKGMADAFDTLKTALGQSEKLQEGMATASSELARALAETATSIRRIGWNEYKSGLAASLGLSRDFVTTVFNTDRVVRASSEAFRNSASQVNTLADQLGIGKEQARELSRGFADLQKEGRPTTQQITALVSILNSFRDVQGVNVKLLNDTVRELESMRREARGAAGEVENLFQQLNKARSSSGADVLAAQNKWLQSQQNLNKLTKEEIDLKLKRIEIDTQYANGKDQAGYSAALEALYLGQTNDALRENITLEEQRKKAAGGSEKKAELDALGQYAVKLQEQARAIKDLNAQQVILNGLHASGKINTVQYKEEFKRLQEEIDKYNGSLKETSDFQKELGDAFGTFTQSVIEGSGSMRDALKSLVAQLLKLAAVKWLFPMIGVTPAAGFGFPTLQAVTPGAAAPAGAARFGGGGGAASLPTAISGVAMPSMPSRRSAEGGGANINIYNQAAGVDVQAREESDGSISVIVERVRSALTRDVVNGGNAFAGALEGAYAVNRTRSRF